MKIKLKNLLKEEKVKVTKFSDWNNAISKLRRGEIIYVDPQTNKDWSNEFHKDFNRKTGSLDVVSFDDKYGGEYLYSKEHAYTTTSRARAIEDFASDVWYKNKKFNESIIKEDKFTGMMFYDSFYFKPQDQHFIYWTVKSGPFEGTIGQYYKTVNNFGNRATIGVEKLNDLKKHGKVKGNPTGAFVTYDGKGYKHARRF